MESPENKGFLTVGYKISDETFCLRHLFVKQHSGKDDSKPSDRTLFILNVPQFFNNRCIKYLYEHCGEIERIFMHKKPKCVEDVSEKKSVFSSEKHVAGYKVVYVVFKESSSLVKALKCDELPVLPVEKYNKSVGLKKWIHEYNSCFIDVPSVQQEIDTFMANYDKKLEEEKQKSKEMETADEDGWVTITKHSRRSKISRKEGVSKRILEKQKKEIEKKTLLNFYRCQLRDKKMQEILELQKRFEKDKKRIALMKENRKFKPL